MYSLPGRGTCAGRVNTCKVSPFSHLNLKFPVIKCSHGDGGKLSPFLSPAEPCPANTHNARVGAAPAAALKVLCFLKTLLFLRDVIAVLPASSFACSGSSCRLLCRDKPCAGAAQMAGRTRSYMMARCSEGTHEARHRTGCCKAQCSLLCLSCKPENGAAGF